VIDMDQLPLPLRNDQLRFIKVGRKQKIPVEPGWQNESNYEHDDLALTDWLDSGGNYGVATGFGNLLVIDFDDEDFQNEFIDKLPKTFTVTTGGSGLKHLYYFCDNPISFKVGKKVKGEMKTYADIQGIGKQVVGPGSVHPKGGEYVVENNHPINSIKHVNLQIIFSEYLTSKHKYNNDYNQDSDIEQIKNKMGLDAVLRNYGYDLTKNPTVCNLGHPSKGGKCFSYNLTDNVWYCFHCDNGGDIVELVKKQEGCDFKAAKTKLAGIAGIKLNGRTARKVGPNALKLNNYMDNVIQFHDLQPFFYDKSGLFWLWNEALSSYEMSDEIDIMNMIESQLGLMGQTVGSSVRGNYLEAFKRVGRLRMPKDSPKHWIQFKSQIFDTETKTIFPSTPEYFFCNPIPWEIGETSETPVMDQLFKDWAVQLWMALKELLAYCCVPDYPIQTIACLEGGGANGKSKYQGVVQRFVGLGNMCSAGLDRLARPGERFESAKLYKKLVCSLGETNFGVLASTEMLKRLSGNDDLIDFEFKNKKPFSEHNYAKIIINTNSLPACLDDSDGFYRRWMIINFPNQFREGRDILKKIPEQEYNNLARWVVENISSILDRGKIVGQGTIAERKHRYLMASNPLPEFIKHFTETHISKWIRATDAYLAYIKFLKHLKKRRVSRREFWQLMAEEGYSQVRVTKRWGSEVFSGMVLEDVKFVEKWEEKIHQYSINTTSGGTARPSDVKDVNDVGVSTSFPIRENKVKNPTFSTSFTSNSKWDKNVILELLKGAKGTMPIQTFENLGFAKELEEAKKEGLVFEAPAGIIRLA
jgi:P4 family phage/plasmid primase-like protien